jgi:uncharacterized protein (DUF433 family)
MRLEAMVERQIVSDPKVVMGKPIVRGTRITVEHLLRMTALGLTTAEIIQEHPHLTTEDVQAAYLFAADLARDAWRKNQPAGADSWQSDGPEWTTAEFSN